MHTAVLSRMPLDNPSPTGCDQAALNFRIYFDDLYFKCGLIQISERGSFDISALTFTNHFLCFLTCFTWPAHTDQVLGSVWKNIQVLRRVKGKEVCRKERMGDREGEAGSYRPFLQHACYHSSPATSD